MRAKYIMRATREYNAWQGACNNIYKINSA